ncbi:hypothetical protein T4B_7996 [Trichinella pseudospiralis]|uniref:Uncharacterized protein n=1 Tax=Trichinella pseudospiralis TaxID=6337 RepID=A0A0V1GS63_TRIPS|nr:hypothetical protein T4B_7996 [Trichinella pseudospiralis]
MTTFASANYGRRQFDQSDTTKVQVVPRYSDTGTRTEYSCYTRDETNYFFAFQERESCCYRFFPST